MIEIFATPNVTSPFLKRSDCPAGNRLGAAPLSIKKIQFSILVIKSKDCRSASRVGCAHLLAVEIPCGC